MAHQNNHKNLLRDPIPKQIYFDTNFIVNTLFFYKRNRYTNLACRYFVQRLFKSDTNIYFSSIIFPEFWHSILKIAVSITYNLRNDQEVYKKLKEKKKEVISQTYIEIQDKQRQFDELMTRLNSNKQRVFVVETEKAIMVEAEKHLQKYNLMSFDAVHLASATINIESGKYRKPPIFDIATMDSDFLHINDRKFSFWHCGCSTNEIQEYEKTLPHDQLLPDGIFRQ
jgi:predicted nucleic acid-binding protein